MIQAEGNHPPFHPHPALSRQGRGHIEGGNKMKIKWLAHSAFLITADSGTRIVTDPYKSSVRHKHAEFTDTADIVTVSHGHNDHNYVDPIKGHPLVLNKAQEIKGIKDKSIKIKTVAAAHDEAGGSKRGPNIIFCFDVDGVKICHCGDLGHVLTDAQVKAIGQVDVLMIPVGGFFTLESAEVDKVIGQLKPKIILPMHYLTDKIGIPIGGPEAFLEGKNNVKRVDGSEIEVTAGKLPASAQIVMLKYSL
jgi:L-ascorbate metabolism protein UlaG (beta-lactamase superfamily)